MKAFFALVALALCIATPAAAQRTIAQDTMSMDSPVAVSCGFCAMEAYGVVFTRVGATGGLSSSDFPLVVQTFSLALGAAVVTGTPGVCAGQATPLDPDTLVHVEIWAGNTVPDAASIASMPAPGMPWPGEDLVFALDDVPVTMSTPTTNGAADFNLMLNTLALDDGTTPAPMVDGSHSYLRVVVGLGDSGMSSTCTPATNAPTGFPLRDDDGVVANHRSFLYAQGGVGWLWNEGAGVHGDWGIRLGVQPLAHGDAGPVDAAMPTGDAATTPIDAATIAADAGPREDTTPPGCSCRVGTPSSSRTTLVVFAALAMLIASRRRT